MKCKINVNEKNLFIFIFKCLKIVKKVYEVVQQLVENRRIRAGQPSSNPSGEFLLQTCKVFIIIKLHFRKTVSFFTKFTFL